MNFFQEAINLLSNPATLKIGKALLAYFAFCAAVDNLPKPADVKNGFLKWLLGTMHALAGNLRNAASAIKVPGAGTVAGFIAILFLLAASSQQLAAQSLTTIVASHVQSNVAGVLLQHGKACFTPTDQNDQPLTINGNGGIISDASPACGTITAGAIAAGFQVVDSATTNPAGIYYRIQVTDLCNGCATKNQVILDLRKVPNVSTASWSLDSYIPTVVTIPPTGGSVAGPLTVVGDFTVTGNCVGCAVGAGYNLIQVAGANLAQRLTVNFVSGITCVDNPGASRTDCTAAGGGGSGSVTSVGLSLPNILFSVSGSPVSTSGIITATLATQSANTIFAGPTSGVAAAPGFRVLVSSDIPALPESQITSLATDLAAKLAAASNLGDLANAGTARTNLGLGTAATHAQTDFSGVGACASSNWVHAVNGNAAPTCTQPAYSDLTGAPTLEYQTVQVAGVAQTQRAKLNFPSGMSCSDNPGAGSTDCSPTTGGSGTVTSFSAGNLSPLFTSSVANPTTTPALSFTLSTAAAHSFFGNNTGVTAAPAFFQPAFTDIAGTVTNAQLANSYSGVGSCAASNWVHAVNANAAPTCTQPAYSDLTGTPTLRYQTIKVAGVAQPQEPNLNFPSGVSCADNPGASSTDCSPTTGGSGTVTSVGLSLPNIFTVSGSPVSTSGTLTGTLATQSANQVFAGPTSGIAAAPTFRALVSADIPNNAANTTGNAGTATALAATPTQCGANNFATGIAASGNANCAQPAYSGITGTPTLEYQTVQDASGTPVAQEPKIEFTGSAVTSVADDAANNRTVVTLTADVGGSGTPGGVGGNLQKNDGAGGFAGIADTSSSNNRNLGTGDINVLQLAPTPPTGAGSLTFVQHALNISIDSQVSSVGSGTDAAGYFTCDNHATGGSFGHELCMVARAGNHTVGASPSEVAAFYGSYTGGSSDTVASPIMYDASDWVVSAGQASQLVGFNFGVANPSGTGVIPKEDGMLVGVPFASVTNLGQFEGLNVGNSDPITPNTYVAAVFAGLETDFRGPINIKTSPAAAPSAPMTNVGPQAIKESLEVDADVSGGAFGLNNDIFALNGTGSISLVAGDNQLVEEENAGTLTEGTAFRGGYRVTSGGAMTNAYILHGLSPQGSSTVGQGCGVCIENLSTAVTNTNAPYAFFQAGTNDINQFAGPVYANGNKAFVASDFATSSTSLANITGLSFTIPANHAVNIPYSCKIMYSQATAAAADQFGIQFSVGPTNASAEVAVATSASVTAYSNSPTITGTTATALGAAFTPSAITTVWNAYIHGMLELPSGAANTINFMVKSGSASDAFTVKRDSYCKLGD